jgi:hypothetical protein
MINPGRAGGDVWVLKAADLRPLTETLAWPMFPAMNGILAIGCICHEITS